MKTRGRQVALWAAVAGLVVLGAAALALKDRLREEWLLHSLEHGDDDERADAAETLARVGSARIIPRLIDLMMATADELESRAPAGGSAGGVQAAYSRRIGAAGASRRRRGLGLVGCEEVQSIWEANRGAVVLSRLRFREEVATALLGRAENAAAEGRLCWVYVTLGRAYQETRRDGDAPGERAAQRAFTKVGSVVNADRRRGPRPGAAEEIEPEDDPGEASPAAGPAEPEPAR